MTHVTLSELHSKRELARAFGCTVSDLRRLSTGDRQALYQPIRLPKKGAHRTGQYRVVYKVVDPTLRQFHKNLASVLATSRTFPPCVQGFVRHRSIVTNARQHLARRFVISADIERFFESITLQRVQSVFVRLGCAASIARTLAAIATLNGALVQGANASPVLANLACADLDQDMLDLSASVGCTYTRYADDITISGDENIPTHSDIAELLAKHGFALRDDKVVVQRRGRKQYVTGLSVFDSQRPRLPPHVKRQLRLILHFASKHGFEDHFDRIGLEGEQRLFEIRRVEGWLRFMRSVEPALAAKLEAQYEDARAID
jgi:RNA-directed DNA polymerase